MNFFVVFIKGVAEWPSEDQADPEDARDLLTKLLEQDPIVRLSTTGAWTSVLYLCVYKRPHTSMYLCPVFRHKPSIMSNKPENISLIGLRILTHSTRLTWQFLISCTFRWC